MNSNINVLVADDHIVFREGFIELLRNMPEIGLIKEAKHGKEAIELLRKNHIHIAILDLNMPEMDGFTTAKIIRKDYHHVKVIALTMSDDHDSIMEMNHHGVHGYLPKMCNFEEVKTAISKITNGEKYFNAEIQKTLVDGIINSHKNENWHNKRNFISGIDKEILYHLSSGLTAGNIAKKMNLSRKTIEAHKSYLFEKTNTDNTTSLVVYAIKNRLINL